MLASASPSEPGAAAQDARERRKLEAEVRAFQRMEALAQRRRAGQDRRADRRASDPCTCGRARKAGRLPKPLSIGGPRCNLCTPVPLPPLGSPANPELPDAPTFYPTEEEFRCAAPSALRALLLPPPALRLRASRGGPRRCCEHTSA